MTNLEREMIRAERELTNANAAYSYAMKSPTTPEFDITLRRTRVTLRHAVSERDRIIDQAAQSGLQPYYHPNTGEFVRFAP